MFKKLNSIKLIVILIVLVGVYFIIDYTGGAKKSKSLRTELVQIDTAKVSKVTIESKGGSFDLFKEGTNWNLTLASGKIIPASESSVKSALGALLTVKPSRMASRKESKWGEYQVDTTGTRVIVFEGSNKTLDIVLGKFGVQGRNAYHTFVRLYEDNAVYAANNFMNFSVPSEPSGYRNKELINLDNNDSLIAVTLNYPADSSVQLSNNGGTWAVNGQLADSTAAASYIAGIKFVSGDEFEDEYDDLTIPVLSANLTFSNRDEMLVEAFQRGEQWIFHSTQNEESYFKDSEMLDKVFKGQSAFLK